MKREEIEKIRKEQIMDALERRALTPEQITRLLFQMTGEVGYFLLAKQLQSEKSVQYKK